MHRSKTLLVGAVTLLVAVPSVPSNAQLIRGGKAGPRGGGAPVRRVEVTDANQRNDLEGAIWEYKVMENGERDRSKQTKMTGRLRIKQTSVFSVGKVVVSNTEEAGQDTEAPAEPGETLRDRLVGGRSGDASRAPGGGGPPAGGLRNRLAGGPQQPAKPANGTERIGDLIKEKSNEFRFRFDEDDAYPLSGRASIKPGTTNRGGLWIGSYDEFENGKKKKRWRFEMRRVEE